MAIKMCVRSPCTYTPPRKSEPGAFAYLAYVPKFLGTSISTSSSRMLFRALWVVASVLELVEICEMLVRNK